MKKTLDKKNKIDTLNINFGDLCGMRNVLKSDEIEELYDSGDKYDNDCLKEIDNAITLIEWLQGMARYGDIEIKCYFDEEPRRTEVNLVEFKHEY